MLFSGREETDILVLDTMAYTNIPVPLSLWDMHDDSLEELTNNIFKAESSFRQNWHCSALEASSSGVGVMVPTARDLHVGLACFRKMSNRVKMVVF